MTDFMRSTVRPRPGNQQGPEDVTVAPARERVRDALAVRCVELEATAPEVLDLVAEVLAELHARLAGRASSTSGARAAKYRREQLRGEHPITLEDLAALALEAGTALGPALARLAEAAGHRIVIPHDVVLPTSVIEAHAALIESEGAFHAAVLRDADPELIDQLKEKIERRWVALHAVRRKVTA